MRETVSKSIDSQIIFQSGSSFHLGEKMHEDGFLDVSKRMMNSVGFFKLSTCAIFSWTCLCLCLKAFMFVSVPSANWSIRSGLQWIRSDLNGKC